MTRHAILALLSISIVSCANPRVAVTLEQASIRTVENEAIFSSYMSSELRHVRRQLVQFRISSSTDLLKYFKDWDRQVQVRCYADGSANGKDYSSVGFGPRVEGIEQGRGRDSTHKAGHHYYVVYSFIDLDAEDVEYKDGKPATTLNLKTDPFESLRCRIVGVQMGSVIFPRSNDFGISAKEFHDLVRRGGATDSFNHSN